MGIFGGGPESVVKKGSRTSGRIVGIAVKERGSEPAVRVDEYAIELADRRVVGVRQRVDPDDVVRLGMPVTVWIHKDDAVIDWVASTTPLGVSATNDFYTWKSIDPPAPGITDSRLGLDKAASKWTPVAIELRHVGTESVAFGLARRWAFDLTITMPGEQPFAVEHKLPEVPHYACHLLVAGARLQGYVDPGRLDRVRIDWPASAMAQPGVGAPPVRLEQGEPDVAAAMGFPQASTAGAGTAGSQTAVVDPPPPIEGVSFEQWLSIERELRVRKLVSKPKEWDAVAAEFGVAPGSYAKASGKWAMSLARRPDLAAAYAAAVA